MGRRQRHKDRTRARLTEVALGMFAEQGYDATTVDMIAERAGVSARTFFRYFETKAAVLAVPGSRFVAATAARLRDVPPAHRTLSSLLGTMAGVLDDEDILRPVEVQAWNTRTSTELVAQGSAMRPRWAAELATTLAEQDGRDEPSFPEQVVCRAAAAVMGAVFDEWYRRERRIDVVVLARQAASAVCDDRNGGPVAT